jgi:putative component of membrane protein insertase Oxa1/YidC/SpoIIIJ protein YidD
MVMISIVGVATSDKAGTGATSILQAVIWVSTKRQLRNATLAACCSYYASCAASRSAAVDALGSQTVVMTYRISRHIGCSPHSSRGL